MDDSTDGAKPAWLLFGMEGGLASQLFMAGGASGHPSASHQKHQHIVHGGHAPLREPSPTIRGTSSGPGEMEAGPQDAVVDELWGCRAAGLEMRLGRVKSGKLDSGRVTRQRMTVKWTSTDGINNDEEKLLT